MFEEKKNPIFTRKEAYTTQSISKHLLPSIPIKITIQILVTNPFINPPKDDQPKGGKKIQTTNI